MKMAWKVRRPDSSYSTYIVIYPDGILLWTAAFKITGRISLLGIGYLTRHIYKRRAASEPSFGIANSKDGIDCRDIVVIYTAVQLLLV